jgi:hypothetical protein
MCVVSPVCDAFSHRVCVCVYVSMWMHTHPGQVFSHALLHRLLPLLDQCERNQWADVSVGKCVAKLGVKPTHVNGFYSQPALFYLSTEQGRLDAPLGLLRDPITFHHLTPAQMHEYEYWLYKDVVVGG